MLTPGDVFATGRHSPKQLRLLELPHRPPLRGCGDTPADRKPGEALPAGYPTWELPHKHRERARPSDPQLPHQDAPSRRHQYTSRT